MSGPLFPPVSAETAAPEARLAEAAWSRRDPEAGALACTEGARWRSRSELFAGGEASVAFLHHKWQREREHRLIEEVWAFTGNRIASRFGHELHDEHGSWLRAHGSEQRELDDAGLMRRREASSNDVALTAAARRSRWPLGPCPAGHPILTESGL